MDKFIIRKTKGEIQDQELVTHNEQSLEPTNSTQSSTVSHDNVKVKMSTKRSVKTRLYRNSYSEMGFAWFGNEYCPSQSVLYLVKYYQMKQWSPVN
jgi:CRISPR/Cas system CMR subunit Cmr4 (Cas7 group RAMP superfamily)